MIRCPVIGTFDPLDPSFLADPFAVVRALPADAPVFYAPSIDYYVVTRHADIEAVFLVPWAVVFRGVVQSEAYGHLKYVFYGEMMVFMVVLFVGLVYVWRKGILEWNR